MKKFSEEENLSESINSLSDIKIEVITELKDIDLQELSEAVLSLHDNRKSFNIGGYCRNSSLSELNAHFRGSILIPDIILIAGKYDKVIAGAIQLFTLPNNKSFCFMGEIKYHFTAPWARGYGMTRDLLEEAENQAKLRDINYLKVGIRADSHDVIELYENFGYTHWGTIEAYEMLHNKIIVPGHFYYKKL